MSSRCNGLNKRLSASHRHVAFDPLTHNVHTTVAGSVLVLRPVCLCRCRRSHEQGRKQREQPKFWGPSKAFAQCRYFGKNIAKAQCSLDSDSIGMWCSPSLDAFGCSIVFSVGLYLVSPPQTIFNSVFSHCF